MRTGFLFIRKDGLEYDLVNEGGFMPYKPDIPLPERRVENIPILGKDSSVTYDYGTYEDRDIVLPVSFKSWSKATNLYKAFNGVQGRLYLNYKDGYFKVIKVGKPSRRDAKGIPEIDIPLLLGPYIFCEEEKLEITKSNTKVFNSGNEDSSCTVKIYGSGDCTFYINGNSYAIKGLDTYIVLNSETFQIYKDTDNQGDKVTGAITKLLIKSGENIITWSTGITKVEITYIPKNFE